ncbi:putative dof zinc finger protein DOF2.5-like [Capsicum annuum]|nr:putative dof zinc finger protein DOF2.5-like [Capsicum annuum]
MESNTVDDVVSQLPLQLIKSEIIPPAPNRSKSHSEFEPAIDWQPNFAGYSWIAYGASSLLVIRQFPNPLSQTETVIGTVFQQVLELSIDGTGTVSAVAWSPVTPSSGDIAAALDNCIGLFSYDSDASHSSFCWSQTSTLVQSTKVDSITWTGSGDGIISGGIELILWRKKERSWEIAWRFKPELPQTLISTTWSIEGPFAAAPPCRLHFEGSRSHIDAGSKCVLVCQRDADSRQFEAMLPHPLPVSMIQWRPSTNTRSTRDGRYSRRLVLLTCCLDGATRLWSEIDDGRVKKVGKDGNEHNMNKFSFRVVAVVEVNQALNGRLGLDVSVRWATDINGIITVNGEAVSYSSSDEHQHGNAGRCEWLIAVGPQTTLTFWAIHCLDGFSPVRAPRVTLWKRKELNSPKDMPRGLLLNKVFIMRNQVFGPPLVCSFINLLPSNYLAWMQFYSSKFPSGAKVSSELISTEDSTSNKCQTECLLSTGLSNSDSHSNKILQVAVHPCLSDLEIASSLDTDGKLLFWLFSSASNTILGLPTLSPSWKLFEEVATALPQPKYTSLSWAPTLLGEERILMIGHADGIDFFVVKAVKTEELKMDRHKICTIPFTTGSQGQGPDSVFSVPLPATCNKTFISNSFLLLAVWKKGFQALSWKIYLHHYDLSGSRCGCSFDSTNTFQNNTLKFESSYSGKAYLVSLEPCSSVFPEPHHHDKISSSAVICPTNSGFSEEIFSNILYRNYFAYHMVTGCVEGSLQLWRSVPAVSSNSQWDLVGMVALHQGPISAISASVCGRKIATISKEGPLSTTTTIHILECVRVESAGSFILEDTLYFDADVVASNWLTIGNGQFLLGVCSRDKLHVYAQKRSGGQCNLEPERSLEGKIWVCLAVSHTNPTIQDFFWGPKAMIVVVHDEYISVFSKFSYFMDKKLLPQLGGEVDQCSVCPYGSNKVSVFYGHEDCENALHQSDFPSKMEVVNETSLFNCLAESKEGFTSVNSGIWSILEIAELVGGSLPLVHPEAFLVNLLSGNWKRSYVALQFLNKHVTSTKLFEKICSRHAFSGLRFPISLSNYLEGNVSFSSGEKSFQWGGPSDSSSWGYGASDNAFSKSSARSEITDFIEAFDKLQNFATISATEMMQIRAAIHLLDEVSNMQSTSAYNSLDGPGRRFWVSVRLQQLYFVQRFGRLPSEGELVVYSGLIGWAFHSDCQENLLDSLLSKQPSWQEMRDMGVGLWYTGVAQLRLKMEKLARQQYLKNKDPKACALLYIALNRLQVLAGLFKISKDEKDKPLVAFLSRNFQEDKNKAAALKNAYVLLGKHQLELAIAFFLLGGDTTSAVTVCAKNLGDEQLALVICRLVEGYDGTLERYLISKFLLPSALAKGDYWLASILEWMLGKYSQAYLRMLACPTGSLNSKCIFSSLQPAFLDPNIGDFCLMLAAKTTMKNAIGEQNAASLSRWAILMRATALSRCGLPLEALECLSSSVSVTGDSNRRRVPDNVDPGCLHEMLSAMLNETSSNWLSLGVAFQIDSHVRSDLSMQYMSKMLRRHPSWVDNDMTCLQQHMYTVSENQEYKLLLEAFQDELMTAIASFQLKFSIIPLHLIYSIFLWFCNRGLVYIGCHLLREYINGYLQSEQGSGLDGCSLYPCLPELFLKVSGELFYTFARYIIMCSMDCFYLKSFTFSNNRADENIYCAVPELYKRRLCWSFWCLRAMMQFFSVSCSENVVGTHFTILDLSEYLLLFASAWVQRNFSVLILIVKPLLMAKTSEETDIKDIQKLFCESLEMMASDLPIHAAGSSVQNKNLMPQVQFGDVILSVPEERWHVMVASFWGYVSSVLKQKSNLLYPELEESSLFLPPGGHPSIFTSSIFLNGNNVATRNGMVPGLLAKILKVACAHISSYCVNQFASVLLERIDPGANTLFCSEDYQSPHKPSDTKLSRNSNDLDKVIDEDGLSVFEVLWDFCSELKKVNQDFLLQDQKYLQHTLHKSFKGWSEMYPSIVRECEVDETYDREERLGSPSSAAGSPLACLSPNNHPFQSFGGKDTHHTKKVLPFRSPREVYKRNGELLEALCINSIDQHEAALASNRKGLLFFKLEDGLPCGNKADNVWAEADWPHNGWAGSESTPIPTCVSPGVGLGSKKGTHLGLGGATVGAGFLARPTFGLPGYTNTGGSSLGWGVQDDFDEFLDPPATVENVRTRAFSTHPSRPFFLVGSSNTHIYLWEFCKDRATATYGVLPAANVPPPYALASVSAVKFDHCGHRFVSAASDGTVCTWQLEVGGRNNVRPTESSLCFNNYTSDVTYVTSSGSIIAAAGYSSSGVNVVIWDTLAPPATSRASIMCHEGGARSLAVFDNDLGSGSISPLIVTGGKGGDVGLHDFRYIATGKTKRHKHTEIGDHVVNSMVDTQKKTGDQNRNGMLWYIPKAHTGSVTKISTIPHTSFFLTGSKDGDVKLWDAKNAKLVFHWPKLHERHTFLQPSSRGFGGVVQAAVTDIQVVSHGFLTCGGDGAVKLVMLNDL